jgi:formylglycine-generating enzyme required for sulfatase activity
LNYWYRLFAPEHGLKASPYHEEYTRRSLAPDCPAIFVTWYDAWVFCQWACWDDHSCRLPHEDEWEYAAKAATGWDWNYWWGDELDPTKCNAGQNVQHTTAPDRQHENPWGFQDILGNAWEWCEDEYRVRYSRSGIADSSARVLRGGSWSNGASGVRSAFRLHLVPSLSSYLVGFRVARALQRKP